MRLISDRVYSARLTAKVLLYQKMTFIFHEQLTFLSLPIPFLPRPHLPVHSSPLYPVWFPSKPSHRCPVNIFKMLPECVALLISRRLTATVHPAGRVTPGWVGRRLLLSDWNQYPLLGLCKSIRLWRARETRVTARPGPPLPRGFWLFDCRPIPLERGPLKFDYYELNPSPSSPACSANPLEAGYVS